MNEKRYVIKLIDDYNETTNLCEVYIPENIPKEEAFAKFEMGQNYSRFNPDVRNLIAAHFDEHLNEMRSYRRTHDDETVFIHYMQLCGYKANIINADYTVDW
ncbi:hypothetical protein J6A31_04525 [bacterium]|nr:hypothetical protein [bacterium]